MYHMIQPFVSYIIVIGYKPGKVWTLADIKFKVEAKQQTTHHDSWPVAPTGPKGPAGPAKPGPPGNPLKPWGPGPPVKPLGPVAPGGPNGPGGPWKPLGPVGPVCPTSTKRSCLQSNKFHRHCSIKTKVYSDFNKQTNDIIISSQIITCLVGGRSLRVGCQYGVTSACTLSKCGIKHALSQTFSKNI